MGIGGERQIGFTFKVFVRPYISQIRMFAIKILVLRVLLETFCAPPYFLGAKKIETYAIHSYSGIFTNVFMSVLV